MPAMRTSDIIAFTNNLIEAWHKLLKSKGLKNKKNRRADILILTLVENMEQILWRALHHRNDWKLRQIFGPLVTDACSRMSSAIVRGGDRVNGVFRVTYGKDVYDVHLRGFFGDGPFCSCLARESHLCVHIMIVILGQVYSVPELLDFAFVGEPDGRLNDLLFRTYRGQGPDGAVPIELEPVSILNDQAEHVASGEAAADPLNHDEQQRYVQVLEGMQAMFQQWRQLQPRTRQNLRGRMWQQFRGYMSENDLNRRTLTGSTVSKLPRVRRGFGGRRQRHGQIRTHSTALRSWLTHDAQHSRAAAGSPLPTNIRGINKPDHLMARRCIEEWSKPDGDMKRLKKWQLQVVCKGLGLTYSGFGNADLILKIANHDANKPPG